jgi:hypothetical protein
VPYRRGLGRLSVAERLLAAVRLVRPHLSAPSSRWVPRRWGRQRASAPSGSGRRGDSPATARATVATSTAVACDWSLEHQIRNLVLWVFRWAPDQARRQTSGLATGARNCDQIATMRRGTVGDGCPTPTGHMPIELGRWGRVRNSPPRPVLTNDPARHRCRDEEGQVARRTFQVVDITEILVHRHAGRSISQVARGLGMDRTQHRPHVRRARRGGRDRARRRADRPPALAGAGQWVVPGASHH